VTSKQLRILDAVGVIVGRAGVAGVSMRAVAAEADVALGLMNYYFDDKPSLIAAALERIGEQDAAMLTAPDGLDAEGALRYGLRVVVDPEYLGREYLSQRLGLWSLANVDERYGEINARTQGVYRDHLRSLLAAARPDLAAADVAERAADILIIQNGIWLTSILLPEPDVVERAVQRCEQIAFG